MSAYVGFMLTNVGFWYSKCPIMWRNFSLQFECNQKKYELLQIFVLKDMKGFLLWQLPCRNECYNHTEKATRSNA